MTRGLAEFRHRALQITNGPGRHLSYGIRKWTPNHRKRLFDHPNEGICPASHASSEGGPTKNDTANRLAAYVQRVSDESMASMPANTSSKAVAAIYPAYQPRVRDMNVHPGGIRVRGLPFACDDSTNG
jgi:hypothetical protein